MKKTLFKVFLTILLISAIAGIGALIVGLDNDISYSIMITTLILLGFSLLGLCCNSIYDKYPILSIIGMLICLISCVIFTFNNWNIISTCYQLDLSLVLLPIALAHISIILKMDDADKSIFYVKISTIILSAINYIIILIGIIFDIELNYRVYLILLILSILGTIAVPVMNKIKKCN